MRKSLIAGLGALALLIAVAAYQLLKHEAQPLVLRLEPGPAQPRVSPAEAGIDTTAIAAAVAYAGERQTQALLIARGGHIVFEKYWQGVTADTAVRFDELTPVVTALLLGTALNDRLIIEIDMPLSRFLGTELQADDSRTLRSLLQDGDAERLAQVLERVTKLPYQTLVVERLWKPLGGGSVSFAVRDAAPRNGLASASCCIEARIADWMRIGQMLARDGVFEANQYTPPGFVSAMLRPAQKDSPRGYFTRVDGAFATRGVAWIGGTDQHRLWVVPSLDLVILWLGGNAGSPAWDEAMIPDSIIRGSSGWQPSSGRPGTDPNQYAPH
jgi:CubicO group peptidase (beta-lactamase class C family)